jgi:glycosyltransferase involved in cell wall biosynthesis
MRILVVTPLYERAWQQGGGVVTCLATLCRALAGRHSVTVYATNASGLDHFLDVPAGEPIDQGGVRSFYFHSTFGPKRPFDSRQLSRYLRKTVTDYDIVYIVALWQWIGVSAARICLSAGVPFVIGTHGGFSRRLRTKSYPAKWLFRRVLLRTPLKRAAAVHLTCWAEKAHAGTWLNGLNCITVPNSVDPARYYRLPSAVSQFRRKYGIPEGRPVVLSVGRPDWKKHIETLIDALRERTEWFLVFVGDDKSGKAPEWKEYADRAGVADRVIWPGFLLGDELLAAFSAGDLFALMSENENFGMVVVEAMLCGLPVLISKEVGVREYLRDQAFAFTADLSGGAVADTLAAVQRRLPELQRRREEIREYAIRQFAPDRVAGLFCDELRKLQRDRSGGGTPAMERGTGVQDQTTVGE